MRKIYSKFVKNRKKEFQIETAIWLENSQKYVTKRSLYSEGDEHINQMYETYDIYKECDILCGASITNNVIRFEYLKGITLEEQLIKAIISGSDSQIKVAIQQYISLLNKVCVEGFEDKITNNDVFGEVVGDSVVGYKNAIFDLTFDNIVCLEQKMKIIDYEWRFPFAVEKNFIKYRAVFAFVTKHDEIIYKKYTREEFFKLFGLDFSKCDKYEIYNNRFIQYVYGVNGYNKLLKQYEKQSIDVCNDKSLNALRYVSDINKDSESHIFEEKTFNSLLEMIKNNKEKYDDYKKFFKVTEKVKKERGIGFLASKEFFEEFSAYIADLYNTMDLYMSEYKKSLEIINENNKKIKELSCDLVRCNQRIEYIESCKAYNLFLKEKVNKQFK